MRKSAAKTFHRNGIGEFFISTPDVVKSKENLEFFFKRAESFADNFFYEFPDKLFFKKELKNNNIYSTWNVKDSSVYIEEIKKNNLHKIIFFANDFYLFRYKEIFSTIFKETSSKTNYLGDLNVTEKKIVIFDFSVFLESEYKNSKNFKLKKEDENKTSISIQADIKYNYDEIFKFIENNKIEISLISRDKKENGSIYFMSFPKIRTQKRLKYVDILDLNKELLDQAKEILHKNNIIFKEKLPIPQYIYDEDRILNSLKIFYKDTVSNKNNLIKDSVNQFHEIDVPNGIFQVYKFLYEVEDNEPVYGFCINII